MLIPQNKTMRQLVWHLYVNTVVDCSELNCYNTERDRNSFLSQASSRMNLIRAYIKIGVLWGANPRECNSGLVEAVGNNALLYRTVTRWAGYFDV